MRVKIVILLSVVAVTASNCWGQAAAAASGTKAAAASSSGKVNAKDQKQPANQPAQQQEAAPQPPATSKKTNESPAPTPNDADTSVREYDISCPTASYERVEGRREEVCSDLSYSAFNNAKEIEKNLDQAIAGLRLRAIDDRRLLISWKGKKPEHGLQELERLIQQQAARTATADPDENRVIRLYNNRNASKVADAIKGMFDGVEASAIGDDIVLLKGEPTAAKRPFSNIDRMVARVDLPRPQVTLNVWSLQMSSRDPERLNEDASNVQQSVTQYNHSLAESLQRGWDQLREEWNQRLKKEAEAKGAASSDANILAAAAFRDYLTRLSLNCPGEKSPEDCAKLLKDKMHLSEDKTCQPDRYCLGYPETFDLSTPSLTRMLLLLAAMDRPSANAQSVVGAMEAKRLGNLPGCFAPEVKQEKDEHEEDKQKKDEEEPQLSFSCFKEELKKLEGPRLGALRAAYADFLFNYKWSISYPNDFVPYELSMSASILDSQLEPFMTALNQDISTYLKQVQGTIEGRVKKGYRKDELYSTGVVSVRAISGLSAEVDTKTANFFNATPPLTVNDIAKNLKDIQTNLPPGVRENLGANAAAALMAGLTSEKPAVARIGRGLTLQATPVSLITASAAELEVTLEANEDQETQVYFKDKDNSKQLDDTSRVAQHKVSTHVRVESMRLFELSSFSASLRRKNRTFPLLPPFVELPYIGSLVRVPLPADPIFHRSFAIASAIVVPTAADLGFGIPFSHDREIVPALRASEPNPVDRCLYEPAPKPADEPKKEPAGKPVPKPQDKKAEVAKAPVAPLPAGDATGTEVKDLCVSKPAASATEQSGSSAARQYVLRSFSSASELSPSVRTYHHRMMACFKDWTSEDCGKFSLKSLLPDER